MRRKFSGVRPSQVRQTCYQITPHLTVLKALRKYVRNALLYGGVMLWFLPMSYWTKFVLAVALALGTLPFSAEASFDILDLGFKTFMAALLFDFPFFDWMSWQMGLSSILVALSLFFYFSWAILLAPPYLIGIFLQFIMYRYLEHRTILI